MTMGLASRESMILVKWAVMSSMDALATVSGSRRPAGGVEPQAMDEHDGRARFGHDISHLSWSAIPFEAFGSLPS
jgi:hypothetical protein